MLGIEPHPVGLPQKVWRVHLDAYIETGQFNPDIIPYLSAPQMHTINEIKKSFIRLKRKYARQAPRHSERAEGTEGPV